MKGTNEKRKRRPGRSFRLALLSTILCTAFALAGCSSQGGGAKTDETAGAAEKAAAQEGTNQTSADSGSAGVSGTLEIQYFVGGYGDVWWKWAIESFKEKYPDVEIIEHAGSDVNETMKPNWISGNPPDVVYIDGAGLSETEMAEDELLLDLTDWYETLTLEDGSSLKENFLVRPSSFDGRIYTLPLVFDTRGVWYDQKWFEDEGFTVPTDYDSWIASMEKIKAEKNIAPLGATGVYPSVFVKGVLYPAFVSEGGTELLEKLIDGEEGAWNSEACKNVIKKVQEMQEKGLIDPNFAGLTHTESQMEFLSHGNAFVTTGLWLPKEMDGSIPEDFVFGMTPTPMNKAGEIMPVIPDIHPVAIAREAKNPEAAKAFVAHIFSLEGANKMAELAGSMMNIKGVDYESNEKVPFYLKTASEMISDSEQVELISLTHAMSNDLMTPIGNELVSLMLGDITAEDFCANAEQAAELYRLNQ